MMLFQRTQMTTEPWILCSGADIQMPRLFVLMWSDGLNCVSSLKCFSLICCHRFSASSVFMTMQTVVMS